MALENPDIDALLEKTNDDKFLLCSVASKRARDINDMMRGQHTRALAQQSVGEIAKLAGRKPLSLSLEEISRGEVSFDPDTF